MMRRVARPPPRRPLACRNQPEIPHRCIACPCAPPLLNSKLPHTRLTLTSCVSATLAAAAAACSVLVPSAIALALARALPLGHARRPAFASVAAARSPFSSCLSLRARECFLPPVALPPPPLSPRRSPLHVVCQAHAQTAS